jgi:Dual specificity phosphatase, catalytic domain
MLFADFESEYDQQKLQGEKKYEKKFIKRTKGTWTYGEKRPAPKSKEGNRNNLSYCFGWRIKGKVFSRISNKIYNKIVRIFKVFDHKTTKESAIYKKVPMKTLVSYENKYKNAQIHNRNCKRASNITYKNNTYKSQNGKMKSINKLENNSPKFISLEQLHPNLYLGNTKSCEYNTYGHYTADMITDYNIKTIINVSGCYLSGFLSPGQYGWNDYYRNGSAENAYDPEHDLTSSSYKCDYLMKMGKTTNPTKMFNFTCDDSFSISYCNFKNFINKGIDLLDENLDKGGVLVICNKGVNRSASIVSAYGMFRKNMSFSEVCDYIDTTKLEKYPDWNNLSNHRFRNLLKLLKSQE